MGNTLQNFLGERNEVREVRFLGPRHNGGSTAGGRIQYSSEMGNTLQNFLGELNEVREVRFLGPLTAGGRIQYSSEMGNTLQNFLCELNVEGASISNKGNPMQNFFGDQNRRGVSTSNRVGYGPSSSSGCKDEWDEGKRNWKDFQKSLKRKKGGEGDDNDDGGKKKKEGNGDGEGSGEKGRAFGGNVRQHICDKCDGTLCNLRPIVEGRVCGHMLSATCLHSRCPHFPNPPSAINCYTGKCSVCPTLTRWNLLEGVLELPEVNYIRQK